MEILLADIWTRSAAEVILDLGRPGQTGFRLPVNCVRSLSIAPDRSIFCVRQFRKGDCSGGGTIFDA